ncbi:hypothetical protein ACQ7B2_23110, partial [Escherichia coli]
MLEALTPGARLTAWLRDARERGVVSVYWNAARIPLEVALARAGRLPAEAAVDVLDGRVLVVEPLPLR